MSNQLNIRRATAKKAARELAAGLNIPISEAVELALISANARFQRHLNAGGQPTAFRATLLLEAARGE